MTPATIDRQTARHLVGALAEHGNSALPTLVRSLAKQGHVALLQYFFADGLIDPNRWDEDKALAYAILPLARHAPAAERAAADALIQDWLLAFDAAHPAHMAEYFLDCPDADTSRELLALGVDPVAPVPGFDMTPRDAVFWPGNINSMLAVLEAPGAAGDDSLISLLLTGFARQMDPRQDLVWSTAWQHAEQLGVLAAGTAHITKHLPRVLESATRDLDMGVEFLHERAQPVIQRWLQAMTWATLPLPAWKKCSPSAMGNGPSEAS